MLKPKTLFSKRKKKKKKEKKRKKRRKKEKIKIKYSLKHSKLGWKNAASNWTDPLPMPGVDFYLKGITIHYALNDKKNTLN